MEYSVEGDEDDDDNDGGHDDLVGVGVDDTGGVWKVGGVNRPGTVIVISH